MIINLDDDEIFEELFSLAYKGENDIITQTLIHQKIISKSNFPSCLDIIYLIAAQTNNLFLLEFISHNEAISNHFNINKICFLAIIYAFIYENIEIVEYLVFNKRIEVKSIDWTMDFTGKKELEKMFLARELYDEL